MHLLFLNPRGLLVFKFNSSIPLNGIAYIYRKRNGVNFFRSDVCCGFHRARIQGVSTLTILPEGLKEETRVLAFSDFHRPHPSAWYVAPFGA